MEKLITNTFVTVADDCAARAGVAPEPKAGKETVASLEYALLSAKPYTLTLDDLKFEVHLARAGVSAAERAKRGGEMRAELLARPQACMRASPLTKSYGWGAHYDDKGRLAIYARESKEYARLAKSPELRVDKAMRNKRP
jgi:Family of unknown function (DUF6157)